VSRKKTKAVSFLRHFLLALQFFTRIPVTGRLAQWVGYSPDMLRASSAHFAGVGWIVGGVAALVYGLMAHALQASAYAPLVAAVFSTIATVLITGGFHEDGLADIADGLGGSYDRARALEIMKDSRVGAFGAMALVLALAAKIALIALLGDVLSAWQTAWVLGAAHVASRATPMFIVRLLPHVGDAAGSKSKPLADQVSRAALIGNLLWTSGFFGLFMLFARMESAQSAILLVVSSMCMMIAWIVMWRLLKRRLQGFTGDALGATQQVCEIAFYLGAAFIIATGIAAP
jgi:adenosylcobinamide-GDP ribazoletransferase